METIVGILVVMLVTLVVCYGVLDVIKSIPDKHQE